MTIKIFKGRVSPLWANGPLRRGFKRIFECVINVSRGQENNYKEKFLNGFLAPGAGIWTSESSKVLNVREMLKFQIGGRIPDGDITY